MRRAQSVIVKMIAVALVVVAFVAGKRLAGQSPQRAEAPRFEVDPFWPKMPEKMLTGEVGAIMVDSRDHIWVAHRPGKIAKAEYAPENLCCTQGPPIIEFDMQGNYLQGWGGPGEGYSWSEELHGIFVDHTDNVWICASNAGPGSKDTATTLLKFTRTGKFLLQIGTPNTSGGSNDTKNLNQPAGITGYAKTNEIFVADGYKNRRVIVFDGDTGAYKRHWGAYGKPPDDAAPNKLTPEGLGPQQFNTLHGIRISRDGIVYVADRANNRLQSFTLDGKFLKEVFIQRKTVGPGTVADVAISPDPQQRFLYIPDINNDFIWILSRESFQVLGKFGRRGKYAGQFTEAHSIATDSQGNVYVGEAIGGMRVQKFVFKGLKPISTE
jgi:hypothetical protein